LADCSNNESLKRSQLISCPVHSS